MQNPRSFIAAFIVGLIDAGFAKAAAFAQRSAPPLPGRGRRSKGRITRVLWDSSARGTYVKKIHGPL